MTIHMVFRRCCAAMATTLALWPLPPAFAQEGADHPAMPELQKPGFLPGKARSGFDLPPVTGPRTVPIQEAREVGILVDRVNFQGNTVISSAALEHLCMDFLGRKLSSGDLELLRQKLTRHYIERGYLNSGVIFSDPPYSGGTLNFKVVEGKLSQVRLHGMDDLDPAYISDRLTRPDEGPLNVEILRERFQLLLDDPLFSRMTARVMPDARLGEAILDIEVVRSTPYQLSLFANNVRSPSIGSEVAGLRAWVRNLTGRGDLLAASLQSAITADHGKNYSLDWSVPLNFRGTRLSLHADHGRSALTEAPMSVLDVESVLDTRQAGISHTFIETLRHKLSLGLDYVDRSNRTTLSGVPFSFVANEPTGTTQVHDWRFWQEYSFRTESQVFAFRSTFAKADSNLQMLVLPPGSGHVPDPDYTFWLGQTQFARQLNDRGLQLVLRATGQLTGDKLLSLDGLAVGGAKSVRGYRENQLLRDNGYYLNLELEYPVTNSQASGALTLMPFMDYGRSWNTDDAKDTLFSAGLALRYRWRGLSLEMAWAKKLDYPSIVKSQSGDLQDRGVHIMIAYDFLGGSK